MNGPGVRPARPHRAAYSAVNLPPALAAGTMWSLRVTVENRSGATWLRNPPDGRRIDLTVWIGGHLVATQPLPQDAVPPGARVVFRLPMQVPAAPGDCEVVLDMIEQNVARFSDAGAPPHRHTVRVTAQPATAGEVLQEKALRLCPWNYRPSGGVQAGADGARYPLFVDRAVGCRFWDTEDREYLDYVMGWGSALLGYAEPRVQESVRQALACGSVMPLPHALEVEVSEMLVQDIPGAERVVFGKNGSDACTVAVRVARVLTGRRTVLYCGYHGWQDWWVEQAGFASTGVPEHDRPLLHRFRFNDTADFERLFALHRDDLAAVMLEPSGPAEGPQGAPQDADPAFLRLLADRARRAGALLVFDEIMTGFRYPGGSVQHATGVVPDLTCLGKALGAGMPLSALVGRAAVMESAMHRTHYGPTFKGEIYSLAAARTALRIYREEPVAAHVWSHGQRLARGIDRLAAEIGVGASCAGPPFRATVVFADADPARVRLERTLFFQELLKRGVMTYNGFMLPSYAHDDAVLELTLDRIGQAFEAVRAAERAGRLDDAIDIPYL